MSIKLGADTLTLATKALVNAYEAAPCKLNKKPWILRVALSCNTFLNKAVETQAQKKRFSLIDKN